MPFPVAGAIGAGLGALGSLFGGIGDGGFGAGERLQPEFAALQGALPDTMKFFRAPWQNEMQQRLSQAFMNRNMINAALENLMGGRAINAPINWPQQIGGQMGGFGNFNQPQQIGGMMPQQGPQQMPQPMFNMAPQQGGAMGQQQGGAAGMGQQFNSPAGRVAAKAVQLRQSLG